MLLKTLDECKTSKEKLCLFVTKLLFTFALTFAIVLIYSIDTWLYLGDNRTFSWLLAVIYSCLN